MGKYGQTWLTQEETSPAVQGWAVLGRWRGALLPRVVGPDSGKLWGKTTSQHQPLRSPLGALPLAAAAAEERRNTKQKWVDRAKNHSALGFFVCRQHRQQPVS